MSIRTALAGITAAGTLIAAGMGIQSQTAVVPGGEPTGPQTAAFDAAAFCREAQSVTYTAEPEIAGYRSVARKGLDELHWKDTQPPNIAAELWTSGAREPEIVTIESQEAIECLRLAR